MRRDVDISHIACEDRAVAIEDFLRHATFNRIENPLFWKTCFGCDGVSMRVVA